MKIELEQLRDQIRLHTHANEQECVKYLLDHKSLTTQHRELAISRAKSMVEGCRANADKAGLLDCFMQEYSLSSKEGVALMCLAESLLRVPDTKTIDALIAEKIHSGNWAEHKGRSGSVFVNASTWGLLLTGHIVTLDDDITRNTQSWIKKVTSRVGEPVVRGAIRQAMKIMGEQYVLGRDIEEALKRGNKIYTSDLRFSFDMLGEGARTQEDAEHYYQAYLHAIKYIGSVELQKHTDNANSISVKLSALHCRYEYTQESRVINELYPKLLDLAQSAKDLGIGLSIDAEEADRLELSLNLFEKLLHEASLADWNGLGFVLQAYGKRAPFVIDWLSALCRACDRRINLRLVKGAYWDSEIKHAQEQGFNDYPVFTKKVNTDLSYEVCAAKLFEADDVIYPQFATHNAQTAAVIEQLSQLDSDNNETSKKPFEFQNLHGMGDLLRLELHNKNLKNSVPIRIYAPVGAHRDLLPYLVRRLLENGANSSFVNRFLDNKVPVDELIQDTQIKCLESTHARNTQIPEPKNIFKVHGENRNHTHGVDLSNPRIAEGFLKVVAKAVDTKLTTGPIISGQMHTTKPVPIYSPNDNSTLIGSVSLASKEHVLAAMDKASSAFFEWNALECSKRSTILNRAADIFESEMANLVGLISYEAGRTINDGIAEVREAVDFLRYYALHALDSEHTSNNSKTNKKNDQWHKQGRGVFFCISPWNFPLAIFVGQIAAALVTGNTVIAKPADSTPLVAGRAVDILHKAGVFKNALHLLPGDGKMIGELINTDPRLKGVAFTGSNMVASDIYNTVLKGHALPCFIAETGGQNAMIVGSSALVEQVVDDVIQSAFLSAGQRCSALRVLYVQEDVADQTIHMLKGAMQELNIGPSYQLETDVGPVIDHKAQAKLESHIDNMKRNALFHYACKLPDSCIKGTFVVPHLFELQHINELSGEVFGPILHVIRFKLNELDGILSDIRDTGFGLTLGVHSRVNAFIDKVINQTKVGNNYINRNMVGAVPGVNPFGGHGLSGTGPKAGGPNYLQRFSQWCQRDGADDTSDDKLAEFDAHFKTSEEPLEWCDIGCLNSIIHLEMSYEDLNNIFNTAIKNLSSSDSSSLGVHYLLISNLKKYIGQIRQLGLQIRTFPGPTGETNYMKMQSRGIVVAYADESACTEQIINLILASIGAGNTVVTLCLPKQMACYQYLQKILFDAGLPPGRLNFCAPSQLEQLPQASISAFAYQGEPANGLEYLRQISKNNDKIIAFIDDPQLDTYMLRFMLEKTITNNIVATGGNTALLSLGENG